jgi:hypothetical protein
VAIARDLSTGMSVATMTEQDLLLSLDKADSDLPFMAI